MFLLGMVVHAYNPRIWEVEAEGSEAQGYNPLQSEFEVWAMRPLSQHQTKTN